MLKLSNQQGMTLAELVIAMAIASLMFAGLVVSLTNLFKAYQAGHQIRATQLAARDTAAKITKDVQDGRAVFQQDVGSALGAICIISANQSEKKQWAGIKYFVDSDHVMRSEGEINANPDGSMPNNCDDIPASSAVKMTADNVKIRAFRPQAITQGGRLSSVRMGITAATDDNGAADSFTRVAPNGYVRCDYGTGSQYCSATNLVITALVRQEQS